MRRLHFGVAAAYLLVAQVVKAFVAEGFVEESLGHVFVVERAALFEQGHESLLYEVFAYVAALDEIAGEGDEHGIIAPEELGDISPPPPNCGIQGPAGRRMFRPYPWFLLLSLN